MTRRLGSAIALGLIGAAIGCSPPPAAERSADRPRRVVAVGGPVTETVFALAAGDRVVAVDTSSTYPAEVLALPKVGYQRALAAEPILALRPDLVLAAHEAGPPAALDQLRAAGVRVEVTPEVRSPRAAGDRIRAIGAAIGEAGPAAELAARVEREATARQRTAAPGAPRVLAIYARGGGTAMVAGRGTGPDAMIALAGGVNAATAAGGWEGYRPLSPEVAIATAPDVVLVPTRGLASLGGIDGALALPGLADTPAGRARRVVSLDDQLLLGFGPRLPEALGALAALLGTAPRTVAR